MKRRKFIKTGSFGTLGVGLLPIVLQAQNSDTLPDVVRVNNGEPGQLFKAALTALGGMTRFISNGDVVVVKPNMGWDRAPEYAANTNPDLMGAIIKSCYQAGAKEVKVFDRTCNNSRRCYKKSRIEEIAKQNKEIEDRDGALDEHSAQLDAREKEMTKEQRAEATELAREYSEKYRAK